MLNINDGTPDDDLRRFSREEIEEILKRAIERQGRVASDSALSMNELIETARELGIDPEVVRAAARDHAANVAMERRQHHFLGHRRKYRYFLRAYVMASALLIAINVMVGGPRWSIFLAFTAGMALAFSWLRTMRRSLRGGAAGA